MNVMQFSTARKPRLVMKFGGTSVANLERIRAAAEKVKAEVARGYDVAVVVSAMSGETNKLVGLAESAAGGAAGRDSGYDSGEHDAVVASGEQVSAGLMALTLQAIDVPARSWQGWQVSVKTSSAHSSARIESIDARRLYEEFSEGRVAVVAGFQGVDAQSRVTTLGRGGSDTSAVALAAAIGADRCDIYTDVDGVYSTDPRVEPEARRIEAVSFEEMLEMASQGAKVLQTRSVELAMRERMPVQVLSSFGPEIGSDRPGAMVEPAGARSLERRDVSGVAFSREEARITISNADASPAATAVVFAAMSRADISVDMICQHVGEDGRARISFTVPAGRADAAMAELKLAAPRFGDATIGVERDLAKVSIVGVGLRSHAEVTERFFEALGEAEITVAQTASSEIRLTVLIAADAVDRATRALHRAFGLSETRRRSAETVPFRRTEAA